MRTGEKEKVFTNGPKSSPRLKGPKALWRKDRRQFRRNESGSKSARMAKLWQFSQGHTKPAFSEKVQRGKFLKNRPKSSPRLKGPTVLWRKWHYPLISMHLKRKDWKRCGRRQRLQKCPNGQVIAIFARSPKTRIFRKSANGGKRESFHKSTKK